MTSRRKQRVVFLALTLSAFAAHAEFSIDDRFIIQPQSDASASANTIEPVVVGQPYQSAEAGTGKGLQDDKLQQPASTAGSEVEPPEVTQKTLELLADVQAAREAEAAGGKDQALTKNSHHQAKVSTDVASVTPGIEVDRVEPLPIFDAPHSPLTPPCMVRPGTLESNLKRLSDEFGGKPIVWLPPFEIPVEIETELHRDTFDECVSEIVRSLQVVGAPIRAVDNRNAIVIRER